MTTENPADQGLRALPAQNRRAAQPAREQPDRLITTGPQTDGETVNIARAAIHTSLSLPPLEAHQELLFRFERTGKSRTYRSRFLESDDRLRPTLERAEQEGLIRRATRTGKIVGFTTAKGSTYELKGTATRRFKKVKGKQYGFSIKTVYLTKEVAYRLRALIKSGGVPEMRNGELWVDFARQRKRGANYLDEKIESTDTPAVGLHPFEEMPRERGHRSWHIGHEITSLNTGGPVGGYVEFKLTPWGRSELRRLQQQGAGPR